ncbi:GNAT family N-acetyltransferase [Desulfitobacterium sp.]|uniref:GNAT family N-acetyltransferase n=1 Tax=Desulfitobacterium sp. TaxID=49981 RepID=UPI002B1F8F26|nr:GNAT family N-acetyltransferase [Desulfitobacterium sp.]MEA4900120.1 GNAT family N-acetyltransferase [Desulfitobacterium sp.]
MEFRQAARSDIDSILNIIKQAQAYFKEHEINQWQNNYPNHEVIMKDINNSQSFVLVNRDKIVGTTAVSFEGEKTYEIIYEGQWLSNFDYAVIHRMAVDSVYKGQGLASLMIKKVEEMCLSKGVHSIKIDTHEDNASMQNLIHKNGFQYCGIIYLQDNSKRMAFEKIF